MSCCRKFSEYEKVREAYEAVKSVVGDRQPRIGLICGSGLDGLVKLLEDPVHVPYTEIPHIPKSTVQGHKGELVFGTCFGGSVSVVCMRGRVHLYEGYSATECVRLVRLLGMFGIKILCATNAAGNLNPDFKPGDFMIMRDHLSFPSLGSDNPLSGRHDERFGDRFVTMVNAYDTKLVRMLKDSGDRVGLGDMIRTGCYAVAMGPSYETVAEAIATRRLGADTIGMSTAHEVIAARQMGIKCAGICLITNNIMLDYDDVENDSMDHEHVCEMGAKRSEDFVRFVHKFIELLAGASLE